MDRRPPVTVSALAFAPSAIYNSLGEKGQSNFHTEYTRNLTPSDVVCVAVTAHSMPHHLEAMIERVGGL